MLSLVLMFGLVAACSGGFIGAPLVSYSSSYVASAPLVHAPLVHAPILPLIHKPLATSYANTVRIHHPPALVFKTPLVASFGHAGFYGHGFHY